MKSTKLMAVMMVLAFSVASQASVNLFTDTFDDDPSGGINGTPNNSVSGVFALTNASNYTGRGSAGFDETGGNATITPINTTNSGMLIALHDFATDADVQSSGALTVSLTDIVPSSTDWLALNILHTVPGGGSIWVNQGYCTALGVLFTPSGGADAFTYGNGVSGGVADWSSDDVSIELTNISGLGTASGSFDYAILSGTSTLASGSASGNLSGLYIGIESRESVSTVSELAVTTVPEPATMVLLGLGSLLSLRKRK